MLAERVESEAGPVPEDGASSDDHAVAPLDVLIRDRMVERGWSYSDLERASGHALTRGRWQQLGSGVPQRKFPDPESLMAISRVLEVDITTVVLAAARTLGLDVHHGGTGLSPLLPAGTARIPGRMREAILTLIRAAVAEARADGGGERHQADDLHGLTLEWPKSSAPSARPGDTSSSG